MHVYCGFACCNVCYMRTYTYVSVGVCMCLPVCVSVCVYVCMLLYVCVYLHCLVITANEVGVSHLKDSLLHYIIM